MKIIDDIAQAHRESREYWQHDGSAWDDALAITHVLSSPAPTMQVWEIVKSVLANDPAASSEDIAVEVAYQLGLVSSSEASDYAGREIAA